MKKVILTRDSVAIADDIAAPHSKEIKIQSNWKIRDILDCITSLNYLPTIKDGKATWSVATDNPLAIITQENTNSPLLICHPDYPHQETKGFINIKRIHFNYHNQQDAKQVFDVLVRFKIRP